MANIGYIQVNRLCNNKCIFCSNPSNSKNITYEEGIEFIDDFMKRNYKGIIFTGGEPTLSSDLGKWIKYCVKNNMDCRIITNGSQCANFEYLKSLKDSGLKLIHFSLYSYIPKVHDFLTGNPGSYEKLLKAIQNALKLGIEIQANCVINRYNQDHLDKTTKFLVKNFPQIRHFVWNNLDPQMMNQTKEALLTLPNFEKASKSLIKALEFLQSSGRTFRVERVPLCFMKGFEFASTETRKIVKNEERLIHFLDFRETFVDINFFHEKDAKCNECALNQICAGIYEKETYYNYVKIVPQKLTKEEFEKIILKIKNEE